MAAPNSGLPTGSQGSSLEGDSLAGDSAGTSGAKSASASQGHHHQLDSSPGSSFDSRQGHFLTIVSEKQARVYQIPSLAQLSGSQQHNNNNNREHHHHHHQTSGSVSGGAAAAGLISGHGKASAAALAAANQAAAQELYLSASKSLLTNKNNLVAKIQISDSSYACRSAVVQMRSPDESCLVSYLATGNLTVHSLPKLRPLMDVDFVPYSSPRISLSMCFSRNGHCLYQPSASEIQKFTLSSQYKALVAEMIGSLYVPREMPEMPRANFFKSLFSVASSTKQSDRDELFGECSSGKPSRGVAKHLGSGATSGSGASGSSGTAGQPSAGGMDKLKGAAVGTMGYEMRMAREGLDERGEKLSEIEDKTLHMLNSSESYAQAAHQLAQKFKDKKWYQF